MKSKNKIKRGTRGWIFLLLTLTLSMTSCFKESVMNEPDILPDVPNGMVRVGLFTNSRDYQTPATRASASEDLDEDSMPWVFVFLGNDDNAVFEEVKQAVSGATDGVPANVVLTQQSTAVRVLIVANAPATFFNGTANVAFTEAVLSATLSGKTFGEAVNGFLNTVKLNNPQTTVPYVGQYLPMTGIVDIDAGISAGTSIGMSGSEVPLTRIVAKVTVANSASGFSLTSASVAGVKEYGRFYQTTPVTTITGNGNINFGDDIVAAASQTTNASPLYIYESAAGETSMIVKGTYNATEGYYRLAFKSKTDGTIMAVERNRWYKFEITSVTGSGYAEFADAVAGLPSNNITATMEVVDLSSHDIIDNGQYYLGVSNSEFIAYSNDVLTGVVAVTIRTNVTATMGLTTNSVTATITGGTGAFTVSPASLTLSDGTNPGVTILTFSVFDVGITEGTITIKLGDLEKTIKVKRGGVNLGTDGGVTTLGNLPVTSANIDPAAVSWLSFDVGGVSHTDYTNPDNSHSVSAGFRTTSNGASKRAGIAYLTARNAGRTMYYVAQNGIPPFLEVSPTTLNFGYNASTKSINVTSNTTWTVTSNQSWCTVSTSSGSNDGSFNVTAATNGGVERTATITVTSGDGSITRTITVTQDPTGGYADRITWDSANQKYVITRDPTDAGLYFKFGSVVGIFSSSEAATQTLPGYNKSTFNAAKHIAWSPTAISGTGSTGWGKVPYTDANTNITDTHHTVANVKAGKGDPCRLVGLDLAKIKNTVVTSLTPADVDNGIWRLPTVQENRNFSGRTVSGSYTFHWWSQNQSGNISSGVAGGEFPERGNGGPSKFLPASGLRGFAEGTADYHGGSGHYWTQSSNGLNDGLRMKFDSASIDPAGAAPKQNGESARCVRR